MPRGGKRIGAGRKPKGDRPKEVVSLTIDSDVIKAIDRVTDNRSEWFEILAKEKLEID